MKEYFDTNKKLWNDKTPVHLKSEMYDLDNFKKGKNSLKSIEIEGLGDVKGKSILHLQCHFGQDSLSLARAGATVTGVDFSSEAIKTARQLNEELGLNANFVEANVLELKEHLTGQFDMVFTSYGTIVWLPDLEKWGDVISHFLKPEGTFYMADFHPILDIFDWDTHEIAYPYFNRGVFSETVEGTYADRNADLRQTEHFWFHSLSETMGVLLKRGMQLIDFQEFDWSPYNCFPNMKEIEKGKYVYCPKQDFSEKVRLPHVFSIKMKG